MLEGGHPLREKLTLFWHNHFATSYAKVRTHEAHVRAERHASQARARQVPAVPARHEQGHGDARLARLEPQREGRPERELRPRSDGTLLARRRQLHREGHPGSGPRVHRLAPRRRQVTKFENNRALHDDGEKTFFGKTGNWTGDDIVRHLLRSAGLCASSSSASSTRFLVSETRAAEGACSIRS